MSLPESLNTLAKQLEANGFEVRLHSERIEAAREILASIPSAASIGRSGSETCQVLGLWESLEARGNRIIDPYLPDLTPEQKGAIRRESQHADVFLSGTNAITMAGHLVNIDGVGNRVSSQIFGPQQVVIVAGVNKICPDLSSALKRIKSEACPKNARRLNLETPCAFDRPCPPPDGCRSPGRMCNATVIIERKPRLTPIRIHLINETLGF